MPDGAAGQGTPTSGRHSPPQAGGVAYRYTPGWFPSRRCPHPRRWRFRARPRFRSVSIAPLAPLRGAVPAPTGRTGRRSAQFSRWGLPCLRVAPPGGLGAMRQFSVRVAPSATRRALPSMRNPDERCLPFQCTDHAERWDSRREGTTSELGVLPAARLRRAVPAPTGRTGRRSAFPCLRVAPPGGLGAMRRPRNTTISFRWRRSCS